MQLEASEETTTDIVGEKLVRDARVRKVSAEPRVRALVPVPRRDGAELAGALHAAAAVRSARKDGGPVTVRIDPVEVERREIEAVAERIAAA